MPADHERGGELNQKSLLECIAHTVVVGIDGELRILPWLLRSSVAQYRGRNKCHEKKLESGAPVGSDLRLLATYLPKTVYPRRGGGGMSLQAALTRPFDKRTGAPDLLTNQTCGTRLLQDWRALRDHIEMLTAIPIPGYLRLYM